MPKDEYNSQNAAADENLDIFTSAERLQLDYGLYKGICYNNLQWTSEIAIVGSAGVGIPNCARYDDATEGANLKCLECHSRWLNFYSNNEWTVPKTTLAGATFVDVLTTF